MAGYSTSSVNTDDMSSTDPRELRKWKRAGRRRCRNRNFGDVWRCQLCSD
nr:hypothetical protein Itr_chr02CG20710 [Ipomoea trifida]